MRKAIFAIIIAILTASPVFAQECRIEEWRAFAPMPSIIMLEGTTTCAEGEIRIRLYSGSGDSAKFIGIAEGFIRGNSFQVMAVQVRKPADLSIKYSVELPEGR